MIILNFKISAGLHRFNIQNLCTESPNFETINV